MELELSRLFVKVIQHGGFSKAAAALEVPKSTISKAVSRLERETGTKLLVRTTRSQSLTAAGRTFFETCLGPLQILEDAQKSLYGADNVLSGNIKITAPEDLGNLVVSPVIGGLVRRHPRLQFELNYTNDPLDLVKDGYDFAVRVGALASVGLRQRKIGEVEMIPVAAPAYLKDQPKIRVPGDLAAHSLLSITRTSVTEEWTFRHDQRSVALPVRPRVKSNQISTLLQLAIAGAGVALVPQFVCRSELRAGRLVRLLPEWRGSRMPVSLLSPVATAHSARLQLVGAAVAEALRAAL